ncbi:MAG: sulfatase-like hydrolase/transferase [Burkholderiaceae bacterium]
MRHDVLLTTDRPTMIGHFRRHGYRTIGLYPALSWDWVEKSFYGFDDFLDGRDLDYQGPRFGLWWIPDQFTVARFEQRFSNGSDPRPQFMMLPTITSHIPFRPVPPYQSDWDRVLGAQPFDDADTARSMADVIDWTDLREPYGRTIQYTFRWLTDYLDHPEVRGDLLVVIGDHQPASSVSGPGASWDVPVHIVTDNPRVLERLLAQGFTEGVDPVRHALGTMDRLTHLLLQAFDEPGRPGQNVVLAR